MTWKVRQEALERKIAELTQSLFLDERPQKKKEDICGDSKATVESIEYTEVDTLRNSIVLNSKADKENK